MKLRELIPMLDFDYKVVMDELPDMYTLLSKLGSKLPHNYSLDIAKKEADKYPELLYIMGGRLYIRNNLDFNLISELKVLKIIDDGIHFVLVGYEKYHN